MTVGPLALFHTIGNDEAFAALDRIRRPAPLSGYLGGELKGGPTVERLEEYFANRVGSKHAIAVNSATSGLLIACMAAGIGSNSEVLTTPFTMSATAAAPAFLGAHVYFGDIEDQTFSLNEWNFGERTRTILTTNLFGHPTRELSKMRRWADQHGVIIIEDNAQAPFAMEHGKYAGTIGHIGVFSFNVHKHLQCGEGGIVVTDDDTLAGRMRLFRNHSELAGGMVGLNLRMTEVTAVIALVQLARREEIISERIEIAETLTDAVKGLPGLRAPVVRDGCKHVYYCWALTVEPEICQTCGVYGAHKPSCSNPFAPRRDRLVDAMAAEDFPMRKGYVEPLYHLPAFAKFKPDGGCPVAEQAHKSLALYENCAWTPTSNQLKLIKEAFHRMADGKYHDAGPPDRQRAGGG